MSWMVWVLVACGCCLLPNAGRASELGEHGFAESGDIKIHYVTAGKGPLVVMLHGFPDFWFTWRNQMPALAKHFQVVAVDLRGYNKSGQPKEMEQYSVDKLVADVAAVIKHFDQPKAIVVGHDWGGLIAWSFAMRHPESTEKLVVLNLPHPWGLRRELANNPEQQQNSQYARNFQTPGAEAVLSAEALATWVSDTEARKKYVEAFSRSSIAGMLAYYRMNYPKPPYQAPEGDPPPVQCPVLAIHGLDDKYVLADGLNENWRWVRNQYTLVTVPDAGHFVQHDRADLVTKTILNWLTHSD